MAAGEAQGPLDEARLALGEARAVLVEWNVPSLDRCRGHLERAARLLGDGLEDLRRQPVSADAAQADPLRAVVEGCRRELAQVRALHEHGAALYGGWMALVASLAGAGYTPRGIEGWPALAGAGRRVSLDA